MVVSPTRETSLLSTWSTIPCTARFTRFTLALRPIRTLFTTSFVTATERSYVRFATSFARSASS